MVLKSQLLNTVIHWFENICIHWTIMMLNLKYNWTEMISRSHLSVNSSIRAGSRRSHDSSGPVELNCDLLPKRSRHVLMMVEDGADTQYGCSGVQGCARETCLFACFYDHVKPKKTLTSDSLPRPAAVDVISRVDEPPSVDRCHQKWRMSVCSKDKDVYRR